LCTCSRLEALAQAGLQGALQLLVHHGAHLVEFGGVALLQLRELRVQRGADLGQAARVGLAHVLQLARERIAQGATQLHQLLREAVELRVLRARGLGRLRGERFLEVAQALLLLQARVAGVVGHLAAQLAFHVLHALRDLVQLRQHGLAVRDLVERRPRRGLAPPQQDLQHHAHEGQRQQRNQQPGVHDQVRAPFPRISALSGVRGWPVLR
jgi:hypothetical protein